MKYLLSAFLNTLKYITSDILFVELVGWKKKSWDKIISDVLTLPKHKDLQIKKSKVKDLPLEFQLRLGDEDGQSADYGLPLSDGRGIHVKVYDDHYKIHWDQKDPSVDPIGHIVHDSPKWIPIGALVADEIFFKGKYRKKLSKTISNFIDSLFG